MKTVISYPFPGSAGRPAVAAWIEHDELDVPFVRSHG